MAIFFELYVGFMALKEFAMGKSWKDSRKDEREDQRQLKAEELLPCFYGAPIYDEDDEWFDDDWEWEWDDDGLTDIDAGYPIQ